MSQAQKEALALDAADGVIDGKHYGNQVYVAGNRYAFHCLVHF